MSQFKIDLSNNLPDASRGSMTTDLTHDLRRQTSGNCAAILKPVGLKGRMGALEQATAIETRAMNDAAM